MPVSVRMLMDRAYEGNKTRQLVLDLGMIPVVPPRSNRIEPWEYDRALYKKRNQIERLFRRSQTSDTSSPDSNNSTSSSPLLSTSYSSAVPSSMMAVSSFPILPGSEWP